MHSLQIGQEYPAGAVSLGKDLAYFSKQTQWNTSVKRGLFLLSVNCQLIKGTFPLNVFTHGNKQVENMVHRQVVDHKRRNLDYNHYLEAIEGNFEQHTVERNRFSMKN